MLYVFTSEHDYLTCPNCGGFQLATVERVYGYAGCVVYTDGSTTWDGYTEMAWDSSETVGISCTECNWEYDGQDWTTHLVPVLGP